MTQSLAFNPRSFLACICRCGYAFSGWVPTESLGMPDHDCPLKAAAQNSAPPPAPDRASQA